MKRTTCYMSQLWLSTPPSAVRGTYNPAIQNTELGNMTSWHFTVQFTQQTQCYIFRFGNVSFWKYGRPQRDGGGMKICFATLENSAATQNQRRQRRKRNTNKNRWQKSQSISPSLICQRISHSELLLCVMLTPSQTVLSSRKSWLVV